MILSGFVTSGWFRVVVVLIYIFNWQAGFRNGIFDSMGVPGGGAGGGGSPPVCRAVGQYSINSRAILEKNKKKCDKFCQMQPILRSNFNFLKNLCQVPKI
jgi:hypothetical protein